MEAFVTLATNDRYCVGAITLAAALRDTSTSKKLCCLITDQVSQMMRQALWKIFDDVVVVAIHDSNDAQKLALLGRPHLGVTFTKLNVWRLTHYEKCVFLDADTLVVKNVDDLFERDEFSAAPDIGWPDCFNSGVFVCRPSVETYNKLLDFAVSTGSFDGGDQGLLNAYFNDWASSDGGRRLPFLYNCVFTSFYSYLPAFLHFRDQIKIVHFIGQRKPWDLAFNYDTNRVEGLPAGPIYDYVAMWWDLFNRRTRYLCGAGSGAELGMPGTVCAEQHRTRFETGMIDYTGVDSFDEIARHLDSKIQACETVWCKPAKELAEETAAQPKQVSALKKTVPPPATPATAATATAKPKSAPAAQKTVPPPAQKTVPPPAQKTVPPPAQRTIPKKK